MKLRVGVIGAGRIGQIAHLQHFAADPRCVVTALADLRPALARSVADKFAIPRVYAHHTALLEDPEVDAVVVITHRYHTAGVVRDALLAGKHVLSEKPMAFDVETARALVALAARQGLVYAVGYMKRHDPWVDVARRALADPEELGAARMIRIHCFVGAPDRTDDFVMTGENRPNTDLASVAPAWLPRRLQVGYDRFLNVYSHDLDLAVFLGGADLKLRYAAGFGDDGHHIVLGNDALTVTLDAAAMPGHEWHEGFEVIFEHAVMTVRLPWPLDSQAGGDVTIRGQAVQRHAPRDRAWAFKTQAADFVSAVVDGAPLRGAASSALRSFELTTEIFRNYAQDGARDGATSDQGEKLHVAH